MERMFINEDFFDDINTDETVDNEIEDISSEENYRYKIWYQLNFPDVVDDLPWSDIDKLIKRMEYAYDNIFSFITSHSKFKICTGYPDNCIIPIECHTPIGKRVVYTDRKSITPASLKFCFNMVFCSGVNCNFKNVLEIHKFISFVYQACNSGNINTKIVNISVLDTKDNFKKNYVYAMADMSQTSWRNSAEAYNNFIRLFLPVGSYGKYCQRYNKKNFEVVGPNDCDIINSYHDIKFTNEIYDAVKKCGYYINDLVADDGECLIYHDFYDKQYFGAVLSERCEKEKITTPPTIESLEEYMFNHTFSLIIGYEGVKLIFDGTYIHCDKELVIEISISDINHNHHKDGKYDFALSLPMFKLLQTIGLKKTTIKKLTNSYYFDTPYRKKLIDALYATK